MSKLSFEALKAKGENYSVHVDLTDAAAAGSLGKVRPPTKDYDFFVEKIEIQVAYEVGATVFEVEIHSPKRKWFDASTGDEGLELVGLIDTNLIQLTTTTGILYKGKVELSTVEKSYFYDPDQGPATVTAGVATSGLDGCWEVVATDTIADGVNTDAQKSYIRFSGFIVRKNVG